MFVGVTPLENLLGTVGDLYCFSNTFRMLVEFPFVSLFGTQEQAHMKFLHKFFLDFLIN